MTTPATPEIDVEDFVIAWLLNWNIAPAGQVAARLPVDLTPGSMTPLLPFVLVQRVAGGDDYITDHATIQVDSFHSDQTSASTIARQVHHAMRSLSPKNVVVVNGVYASMNHIEFEQTPIWVDYEDPLVMRYVARYVIDVRLPLIGGF